MESNASDEVSDVRRIGKKSVLIALIVLSFALSVSMYLFVVNLWYPSLVLYYYLVKWLNLYEYSLFIRIFIIVLMCCIPLIYLLWKLFDVSLGKIRKLNIWFLVRVLYHCFVFFLMFSLIILSLEISLTLTLLFPIKRDIKVFINSTQQECGSNVSCIVKEVVKYIDLKISWSYNNPMSVLEIDNMLSQVDYQLLGVLGFSKAHVVLWQGWGSCGEHAIVVAYLLYKLGYNVRIANFSDIDHVWTEVYIEGSWYIVDPWYIGIYYEVEFNGDKYLVPIDVLASLKNFTGIHEVLCEYLNGTQVSCSTEHGYHYINQ